MAVQTVFSTQTLEVPSTVSASLRQASARTGVDFDYLAMTAARESSFNSQAKAKTSSATGLFQFIDQTWLSVLKQTGASHGLGREAAAIQQDSQGRYFVPDRALRAEIMDLRKDPSIASLMAGELTAQNSRILENALGRAPSNAELYMAHFMGPSGASKLLTAAERMPDGTAADLFPREAAANKPIFFKASGEARTLQEVVAELSRRHGDATVIAQPMDEGALGPVTATPPAPPPGTERLATSVTSRPASGGSLLRMDMVALEMLSQFDPLKELRNSRSAS